MSDAADLVRALCDLTGRRRAALAGRGATAIYAALRAAGLHGDQVALPANICPAAVCPVLYSGNTPLFCDIDLTDFNVDPASLREALDAGAAAVIIPHSYGHVAPMSKIARLCDEAGALLIEDAAPSLGATAQGKPAGAHGHCSVLSFGYSKIIDAGGGGALVTDDEQLAVDAGRIIGELPEPTPQVERRATDMAHVVRGWWNGRRTEPQLDELLRPIWALYADAHLYGVGRSRSAQVMAALGELDDVVARRRANFDAYQEALSGLPIRRPEPRDDSVPWRYTFLMDEHRRDAAVEAMRGRGLDVSTLYPAAHRQFDTPTRRELANCDRLDREVVNLWVAPPLFPADIRRDAAIVAECLEEAAL